MPSMRETMDGWGRQFLRSKGFEIPNGTRIVYKDDSIYHEQETWTGGYSDYYVEVSAPDISEPGWPGYPAARWSGDLGDIIRTIMNWEEDQDDRTTT